VPYFKYFIKTSEEDYNNYKDQFINKIWDFKEESLKYCIIDCVSLYQILVKFNKLIYQRFHLNIQDYPTLPSLAFSIFRSNSLKKEEIHQLSGDIDRDIRLGYTGGSVDMYIPYGENIYGYDINSLYPSVMSDFKFPIGTPTYFEGDILKTEPNAFGFFYVNIITPESMLHPILQIHHKTNDGVRTISPLGNFSGWFSPKGSEELYNAQKYGYTFEILRGYTFEKDYIFKDYVNDLYNLRLTYDKSNPLNYTAKILLNSLYGRFGMNDSFNILEIVGEKDLKEIESDSYNIDEIIHFKSNAKSGDKFLISYNNPDSKVITKMDGNRETHNVNIAIASAVTAYARILMSQFKNNNSLPFLYYTDTDSLYFDGPLHDTYIS
jgi:DNA polymerase elongation subunit (family B)